MFLAGSVLIMLGLIVLVAGSVAINNLLHKYWKPVRMFTTDSFNSIPARYATEEELAKLAPTRGEKMEQKSK